MNADCTNTENALFTK